MYVYRLAAKDEEQEKSNCYCGYRNFLNDSTDQFDF